MILQSDSRRLFVCLDVRCVRDVEGTVYSDLSPAFFERYTLAWRRVRILTRLAPVAKPPPEMQPTLHPAIHFVDSTTYDGIRGYLATRQQLQRTAQQEMEEADDIIIRAWNPIGQIAWKLARRMGRSYAVEVGGDPWDVFSPGAVNHPLRPVLRRVAARQLAQQCYHASGALYVTCSALQRRYPCPNFTAGVSNVDLTDEAFAPRPRDFGGAIRRWRVIGVGTMAQRYKGFDVLLEAMAACVRSGLDLELVLVGDGLYRAELEAQSRRLGIQERVCFTGKLPPGAAVRAELDQSDLFVLPSRTEGLPRAMLEAMARGLPVVGSAAGGVPELLQPDEMAAPSDAAALAAALRLMLHDPQRMSQASHRNWLRAREYHRTALDQRRYDFYRLLQSCSVRKR